MAYQVYQRLPSGGAKNYIDTNTSEIISARKYRNLTEAKKSGFDTISAKQRAVKYEIQKYPRVRSIHHHYKLGVPDNLPNAIGTVIDKEKKARFGYGMFITGLYLIYPDEPGPPFYRSVSSLVWKLDHTNIQRVIDEMNQNARNYGETVQLIGVWLDVIDIDRSK